MDPVALYVEVPFCSFRPHTSRDYQDTYPFPPPATVFGMLLSLAGIDWPRKREYAGVELALALQSEPGTARVFRKLRRVAQSNKKADPLADRRPDYQELLVDLRLWIWLRNPGNSSHSVRLSLPNLVEKALSRNQRAQIARFGGLALGESSNLVNEIVLNPTCTNVGDLGFLIEDAKGEYNLPVWVDHPRTGQDRSLRKNFTIHARTPQEPKPWIAIRPPET